MQKPDYFLIGDHPLATPKKCLHLSSLGIVAVKILCVMRSEEFIGYVGVPDIHDGTILRVFVDGSTAEVVLEGYSRGEHAILFEGVAEVEMNEPEGMLLYSLSEMRASSPLRKFVFTNNEEDSQKSLSVLATGFRIQSK